MIFPCPLPLAQWDSFSIVLRRGAYSGALPQFFPFPWGSLFARPILSLPEASISLCPQKGKNKVDDHPKKAALFIFLASDANHVTRLSIPAAMRAKGYSDVEALDGTLVQQVHRESQKIKTPCPESVAASSNGGKAGTSNDHAKSDGCSHCHDGWDQCYACATTLVAKESAMPKEVCQTTAQVIIQVEGEFRGEWPQQWHGEVTINMLLGGACGKVRGWGGGTEFVMTTFGNDVSSANRSTAVAFFARMDTVMWRWGGGCCDDSGNDGGGYVIALAATRAGI